MFFSLALPLLASTFISLCGAVALDVSRRGIGQVGFSLHPNGNTSLCVTSVGGFGSGAALVIDLCTNVGVTWGITRGQTQITADTGAVSFDAGDSPQDGTPMKIWLTYLGIPAQDFWYTDDNRIALTGRGLCLDLTNGNMTPGTRLQLWKCTDGNTNQIWTTQSTRQIYPNGDDNLCLLPNFNHGSPGANDGDAVLILPCSGTTGWTISLGVTTVTIEDDLFSLYSGPSPHNGSPTSITFASSSGVSHAQSWTYTNDNTIVLTGTNLCLDLTNGNHTAGNVVQVWECFSGNTNQVWTFSIL